MKKTYSEKLKDPRWQKQRLQILERDNWKCRNCDSGDETLHIHHRWYEKSKEPWEYPDNCLITLCEGCHKEETFERESLEKELIGLLRKHFLFGDILYLFETLFHIEPFEYPDHFIDYLLGRMPFDNILLKEDVKKHIQMQIDRGVRDK